MAKSSKAENLAAQATFVFKGTVKKLKATTFAGLKATDKTVVVSVDEIVRAPEVFHSFAGTDITVQLGSRENVKKGERAIFYTNSWMLGESLGVKSVGHAAVVNNSPLESVSSAGLGDAASERLQAKVADADTVVTGKVTDVRLADTFSMAKTKGRKKELEHFEAVSEHNPVWQEAVIEVADVEKGKGTSRQIVVRFPESTDVRWYEAPKFEPGQEAVFLLKDEKKSAKTAASAITKGKGKAAAKKIYTALDSESIQPLRNVSAIRTLIKTKKG